MPSAVQLGHMGQYEMQTKRKHQLVLAMRLRGTITPCLSLLYVVPQQVPDPQGKAAGIGSLSGAYPLFPG